MSHKPSNSIASVHHTHSAAPTDKQAISNKPEHHSTLEPVWPGQTPRPAPAIIPSYKSGTSTSPYYRPSVVQEAPYYRPPPEKPISPRTNIREKRICGLRPVNLWLVVALAASVVLSVSLGVGIGVGLGRAVGGRDDLTDRNPEANQSQSSSPNPTPAKQQSTTTTNTATTVVTTTKPPVPICPSTNDTVVQMDIGLHLRYRILCDAHFDDGGKQEQPLAASTAMPTFNACLDLCNSINRLQNRTDVGFEWDPSGNGGVKVGGACLCLGSADKLRIVEAKDGGVVALPLPPGNET
ncbi:hypothetical protein B0H66DRAFT_106272 [Apodospora peruviana]|uniref:Uncharacterized protein n=1 Tax=Apodospora peruviana TaxID=516989 RepID=A0AAE0MBF0_9PEZI|nr:hypothetical protein B0H66DRAFT_106272 [Apodospora peruviana]